MGFPFRLSYFVSMVDHFMTIWYFYLVQYITNLMVDAQGYLMVNG